MFKEIMKMLTGAKKSTCLSKDEIAKMLSTDKEALEAFERAYHTHAMSDRHDEYAFETPLREIEKPSGDGKLPEEVVNRIVKNLAAMTDTWHYDPNATKKIRTTDGKPAFKDKQYPAVRPEEIQIIVPDKENQPQLTDCAMQRDIDIPAYEMLLTMYDGFKNDPDPKKRKHFYHMFRQGLDIQDLDPVTWEILGMNKNTMGYWLPRIAPACDEQGFFKIPRTTIIKVPIQVLQLTRLGYGNLTAATLDIVDKYCREVFGLKDDGDYFIKTGTFSSKFDFRNARVNGKEIDDLGEYLLFINSQAVEMAGPLSSPSIYGMSTTNEWVVREFIKDKHSLPTIYKGLPLRTEYRLFIDFDRKDDPVIGTSPYWKPEMMKKRFERNEESPHDFHDYITFQSREKEMMREYKTNIGLIKEKAAELAKNTDLTGQWSLDIMQEGDDFYLIDMAEAANSALNECVPEGLLIPQEMNWELPKLAYKESADE